ncbi:MAG: hypothetical protein HY313_02620 [Acidobacteria bacterium]|nr:hypothetical protein [Acidobacteriota bacterium]
MFTVEQLRQLANFHSNRYSLATFYWKAPPAANRSHRGEETLVQDLFREVRQKLESENHGREWWNSFEADQERILQYLRGAKEGTAANVAVFSCAGESFCQILQLPRGLHSGFVIGENFYLQPLSILLDQYHRSCTVLVDRASARIFEIYMGEIEEHTAVLDEVPGKVKAATWRGGNERQIERRVENKAHQHYKRVAEVVLGFFKKYHFDWLILGGHGDGLKEVESYLHSYLRSRLIGTFAADVKVASLPEIMNKSTELIEKHDGQEKRALVQDVLNKASRNGMAVVGLADTLRVLSSGQVHTLVLEEDLRVSAARCRNCGAVTATGAGRCPECNGSLEQIEDVVEQAVQAAIQDNSQIRFVSGSDELRQAGGIGALLRFRTPETAVEL